MIGEMIKKGGVLVLFSLLIAACGDVGGSGQCGGAEVTGSCLRIEKIEPGDGPNPASSNVDVVQDTCSAGPPPEVEDFTDHSAKITFSNSPMPGVLEADRSDITLGGGYTLTYAVNRCPTGATCPSLPSLNAQVAETVRLKVDESTVTVTFPFFPIATKIGFVALGGSTGAYPSYTATYTFNGTDSFQNPVSVTGSAEFTVGAFANCS